MNMATVAEQRAKKPLRTLSGLRHSALRHDPGNTRTRPRDDQPQRSIRIQSKQLLHMGSNGGCACPRCRRRPGLQKGQWRRRGTSNGRIPWCSTLVWDGLSYLPYYLLHDCG